MQTATAEQVIESPYLIPAPTGLLQAVDSLGYLDDIPVPPPDASGADRIAHAERWLAGVTYEPESAAPVQIVDPCAPGTSASAPFTCAPPRVHHPLMLEVADTRPAFGFLRADGEGKALRALLAKESTALEAEFESGTRWPEEPHLTDGILTLADGSTTNGSKVVTSAFWSANHRNRTVTGAGIGAAATVVSVTPGVSAALSVPSTATASGVTLTVTNPQFVVLNTGTAVSPAVAFALLQEAIAIGNIGMGMVHATAFLVERWAEAHALRVKPDPTSPLYSVNGNVVVAGNGYTGKGYDGTGGTVQSQGATSAVQWAYATGLIGIKRAATPTLYPPGNTVEERMRAALNRDTNQVTYLQSRPHLIAWPGLLHAAVKVNVTA